MRFRSCSMLLVLFLVGLSSLTGQERYSQIRIPLSSPGDAVRIHDLGIALDDARGRPGRWLDVFVSETELGALRRAGIPFTTLIDDWDTFYADRLARDLAAPALAAAPPTVRHFHLGSMGGYMTLPELVAELDSMRRAYPGLISARDSIGSTVENRPIWAVRISARADVSEAEPRALYTGMHHAREAGGMMTLVYSMWYLLERYGADPEVTDLLDHRELTFVPVMNADGYEHNRSTRPAGGGTWRKNRRLNPQGTYGVDLNRNYGYRWGYDNIGSSSVETNGDYRGAGPFSEPENRAIRDLCVSRRFAVALNYHSYGNLMIRPWGYVEQETPDSLTYWRLSDDLTAVNRYAAGLGPGTVGYTTNGDADDWMYGDTLGKPRIFSWTPEIGSDLDGFWPVPSRILPIAEENLRANLALAHAAGEWVGVAAPAEVTDAGADTVRIQLRFADKGLAKSAGPADISLASSEVQVVDASFGGVVWQGGPPLTVRVLKRAGWWAGQPVHLRVAISYAGGSTIDTASFRLGAPQILYADDAEGTRARWKGQSSVGPGWDTTSEQAHSGRRSLTDSRGGRYPDGRTCTFTLDSSFSLVGTAAELRFWTKWQIEAGYDAGCVEASVNDGVNWTPLPGRFTGPASGVAVQLPAGAAMYDGGQPQWVEEVIDLSSMLGSRARFRFRFVSDQYVNFDGMYVDDIRLLLYRGAVQSVAPSLPWAFRLEQNYPNPFNPSTTIRYELAAAAWVTLGVYDILGREVAVLVNERMEPGRHAVRFDASRLAGGVYLYQLRAAGAVQARRLVLLR